MKIKTAEFIHRKHKRVGVGKGENGSFFFSRASRSLSRENLNCQVVKEKRTTPVDRLFSS